MAPAPLPRTSTDLPVESHADAIAAAVADGGLVLTAEPGAGKTSIVPLVAAEAVAGRVLLLQPRRLAARAAARRLADLVVGGGGIGGAVGLTMRGERRVGADTRVEVMTEAVLTNRLQRDPELEGVGAVVFDEFHERNLHSDLGLAMAIESRAALRPDLALVVMSATLDAEPVAGLLAHDRPQGPPPVIAVPGRTHPVETIHLDRPDRRTWPDAVAAATRRALAEVAGDVLVFVPGRAEIARVGERLRNCGAEVIELHGGIPPAQRDRVLEAGSGRRVVVATAVAETSVTLPGIEAVVDGGLARHAQFDAETGLGRLETRFVTRFSADQRRGRAGRLGPGRCYRLWSASEHAHLDDAAPPEIQGGDPVPVAYELARWGDADATSLPLLDHPGADRIRAGRALLDDLGLVDGDGTLSRRGRRQARLGVHPRTGALLFHAHEHGLDLGLATLAAAALEDDGLADGRDFAAELDRRRGALQGSADRLRRRLDQLPPSSGRSDGRPDGGHAEGAPRRAGGGDDLGSLLAGAWPDRIALTRSGRAGSFLAANGHEVAVPEGDPLARHEFLVVVEADGRRPTAALRRAVGLDRATALAAAGDRVAWHDHVRWDDRTGAVKAERQRRLGAIVLHTEPLDDPPVDLVAAALAEGLRRRGLDVLPWPDRAVVLRQRLAWLHRQAPDVWPAVDDDAVVDRARAWIAAAGSTSLDDLARLDVAARLLDDLDWRLRADLDRLAPTARQLPTGRSRRIDYAAGRPVWSVRLQDVLGLDVHPTIGPHAEPLTVELLSPADRPAQVTTDLPGFWRGTYAAVRADLRGRYPKHRWPERPWEAEPGRRTRGR
ncbi:MAG: ATP-dependent helicase HrpB [Actinomycetota bacterium]